MEEKMILGLLIVSTFVGGGCGFSFNEFRNKRQVRNSVRTTVPTAEECMKPPMKRFAYECCQLPKEKIWGDISDSLNKCFARRRSLRQQMGMNNGRPDDSNIERVTEPNSAQGPRPYPRRNGSHEHRRPWKKTHIFKRRPSDACFMECVFEDQGFLMEKRVNKEALLTRLRMTLGNNPEWHRVAVQGVETCYATDFSQFPNNSTCVSRSEEIFRCVFRYIFFNCPTWPQRNEYCTTLKDFYQKCPNSPPPEMEDNHTTSTPEEESEAMPEATPEAEEQPEPETETEGATESETEAETVAPNDDSPTEETQ